MTIFIVAPDNLKLPTSVFFLFFFCIVMAKASYIFKKDTSIHMYMKERLIPLLQIELTLLHYFKLGRINFLDLDLLESYVCMNE